MDAADVLAIAGLVLLTAGLVMVAVPLALSVLGFLLIIGSRTANRSTGEG